MKQLVQSVKSGDLRLIDVPVPVIASSQVLVATSRSTVSPGTERMVRELASASLLGKARARPDLVRQVIARAQSEGVLNTAKAVRSKLDDLMPLGYSGVGTIAEVGEHVDGLRVGQRVATGGAGHGEYQVVSGMLAVPVPESVSDTNAAFATVSAIAMHGIRLADVQPGARVAVVGLGLLGQISLRLLRASGCQAYGVDLREFAVEKARSSGFDAELETGADTTRRIVDWSRNGGADAVLITAGTASSEPAQRSIDLLRDRGVISVVGAVGMDLDRNALFEKEATVRVARSYGPGRYERSYEGWGVDYPVGQVRWTEGRNLESVLDLMSMGVVDLEDLVTHSFGFDDATSAYEQLSGDSSFGIQLKYPVQPSRPDRTAVAAGTGRRKLTRSGSGPVRMGLIGAGNFVRATMLPALDEAKIGSITAVCSATGVSARHLAESNGIPRVHTDAHALIEDDTVDAVLIASPHSTHADLVVDALRAGKPVFCEKPLALTAEDLERISQAVERSEGFVQVGFNRRHSPSVRACRETFRGTGPMVITYRVNAGELPESHWYFDRREGGRVVGEVCHFIDTAAAIAGDAPIIDVKFVGSGEREPLLDEDIGMLLSFANGAVAAITYASHGEKSMPKEQISIIGHGHTALLNNFEELVLDGRKASDVAGKGHHDQFTVFAERVRAGSAGQIFGFEASRIAVSAVSGK